MISNYIFNYLSQDSVDSTAVAALPALQLRNPDLTLTSADVPDYLFKSLKTLLADSTSGNNTNGVPQWAVNRIRGGKQISKFTDIHEPEDYPLIFHKTKLLEDHPQNNLHGAIRAKVEITVFTNPEMAASNVGYNIMQRINSLFIVYGNTVGAPQAVDIAQAVTTIKGVKNLFLSLDGFLELDWDQHKCLYTAEGRILS